MGGRTCRRRSSMGFFTGVERKSKTWSGCNPSELRLTLSYPDHRNIHINWAVRPRLSLTIRIDVVVTSRFLAYLRLWSGFLDHEYPMMCDLIENPKRTLLLPHRKWKLCSTTIGPQMEAPHEGSIFCLGVICIALSASAWISIYANGCFD